MGRYKPLRIERPADGGYQLLWVIAPNCDVRTSSADYIDPRARHVTCSHHWNFSHGIRESPVPSRLLGKYQPSYRWLVGISMRQIPSTLLELWENAFPDLQHSTTQLLTTMKISTMCGKIARLGIKVEGQLSQAKMIRIEVLDKKRRMLESLKWQRNSIYRKWLGIYVGVSFFYPMTRHFDNIAFKIIAKS